MEFHVNWLLKSSFSEIFGDRKYDLFLNQEVDGKVILIFTDYWKSSCFELFGDGKYGLFLGQKVDGKAIFTWCFWALHDIPGLKKYGFLSTYKLKDDLLMIKALTAHETLTRHLATSLWRQRTCNVNNVKTTSPRHRGGVTCP